MKTLMILAALLLCACGGGGEYQPGDEVDRASIARPACKTGECK